MIVAIIAAALAAAAPQAVGQQRPDQSVPPTAPAPTAAGTPSDDIVVEGLRDIDSPGSAVTRKTLGSGRNGSGATRSRTTFGLSERFATCAVNKSRGQLDYLRKMLDGNVNSARQRFAQMRFVQTHATCAQDATLATQTGIATIDPNYDTSYYDRGAVMIRALQVFAPDLTLTARQTADPAVQARFNAREIPRARFRLPVDEQYFETAVCLVRLQPELSVRLMRPRLSVETMNGLEAAIVDRAKVCVGNARQVYFDGSQMRFYLADAVYRWAVAARGVESLLPPDPA